MNLPAQTSAPAGDVMELVIAKGDLAKLTPDERVQHYTAVCKSLGLNPLTQPFMYITLNGKLVLYATRTCTDQLRKINGVSLEVVSRRIDDDILTVHVKATTPDGRSDEDFGSVAFPSALKGEARANAVLKAITKAKRRTTLSICGLGWPDESELESIPGAKLPPHNPTTGEITESAVVDDQAPPSSVPASADAAPTSEPSPREVGAALLIEQLAKEAAMRGAETMRVFWSNRTKKEQEQINKIRPELNKLVDDAEARIALEMGDDGSLPKGSAFDDHTAHLKLVEAFKHGQQAKADGHLRRAIPPEYRRDDSTREALCWQSGFDGDEMPEFNTGD